MYSGVLRGNHVKSASQHAGDTIKLALKVGALLAMHCVVNVHH